jgi:hypothetical protein
MAMENYYELRKKRSPTKQKQLKKNREKKDPTCTWWGTRKTEGCGNEKRGHIGYLTKKKNGNDTDTKREKNT